MEQTMDRSTDTLRQCGRIARLGNALAMVFAVLFEVVEWMLRGSLSDKIASSALGGSAELSLSNYETFFTPARLVLLVALLGLLADWVLSYIPRVQGCVRARVRVAAGWLTIGAAVCGRMLAAFGGYSPQKDPFFDVFLPLALLYILYSLYTRGLPFNATIMDASTGIYWRRVGLRAGLLFVAALGTLVADVLTGWRKMFDKSFLASLTDLSLAWDDPFGVWGILFRFFVGIEPYILVGLVVLYIVLSALARWDFRRSATRRMAGRLLSRGDVALFAVYAVVSAVVTGLPQLLAWKMTTADWTTEDYDAYTRLSSMWPQTLHLLAALLGVCTVACIYRRVRGLRVAAVGAQVMLGCSVLGVLLSSVSNVLLTLLDQGYYFGVDAYSSFQMTLSYIRFALTVVNALAVGVVVWVLIRRRGGSWALLALPVLRILPLLSGSILYELFYVGVFENSGLNGKWNEYLLLAALVNAALTLVIPLCDALLLRTAAGDPEEDLEEPEAPDAPDSTDPDDPPTPEEEPTGYIPDPDAGPAFF